MNEAMEVVLRKALAVATAAMLVATLSALAVVRADNRTRSATGVAAGGIGGGGTTGGVTGTSPSAAPVGGDPSAPAAGDAAAGPAAAAGGASATAGGAPGGGGGAPAGQAPTASAAAGGGRTAAASNQPVPSNGTDCPDYNPNIGVYCDRVLVGGTTVLSGPLAVYGDQGLKGGLAWLAHFNSVIAPREKIRQFKLVWYNDDLDPNKTLQYVQRLNEVDKVLYLGGITSPEAASRYLETAKFPMIGDIGLSPKSYKNRYIFPTAPSEETRNPLRVKIAKQRYNVKSFAVVQDVLPSVDTTPIKAAWQKGASDNDVELVDYVELSSTASDCSGQFSRVIQKKPEYIVLPTATGVLLACLREAKKFSVQPGGSNSPWLKGWTGGSNLQVEVDNCKPLCEGMLSIGTIFADPRSSQSDQMKIYRENMAKYAPNVDITGFIAINYYHTGWIVHNVIKSAGITWNLNRENLVDAAEKFGPFDTGFGNTVTWRSTIPREPWNCAYPVIVNGDRWEFESQKTCG